MYSKLPFIDPSCAVRVACGVSIVKWQKALCSCLYSGTLEQIMLQSFLLFYSIWIKSTRINSLLLAVCWRDLSYRCAAWSVYVMDWDVPCEQPRDRSPVTLLHTGARWFAWFIQITPVLRIQVQLNCSWDKKVVLAESFLISRGSLSFVWKQNLGFVKGKLKSFYLDCCLQI